MRALTALPTLVQTESYAPMRSRSSIIQKNALFETESVPAHREKQDSRRSGGRGVCVFNDGKGKASNSYANPGTCRVELGIHWG